MRYASALLAAAVTVLAAPAPTPDADGKYTLEAEGIRAQFIPYGASLTNLFVKDRSGKEVDVVLGYDKADYYPTDPSPQVYNSIPGRYANRIGDHTYELDGTRYYTVPESYDNNTLHGGPIIWAHRIFNISEITKNSITFTLYDKEGTQVGFPGNVDASITYKLSKNKWSISMTAKADKKTPLMLTQHVYFNLDAYKAPVQKIWDHTLHLPYSQRYLENKQDAVPTGKILTAAPGSINDFHSKKDIEIGATRDQPGFAGNCGADGGCEGYNGYFLFENVPKDAVVASLASDFSGIKAELRTNQVGIQLYSCNWFNATAKGNPLKRTQGSPDGERYVERSSCVAIEPHDFVDGINHPEWGRKDEQITGPGETYQWESSWSFSTFKESDDCPTKKPKAKKL